MNLKDIASRAAEGLSELAGSSALKRDSFLKSLSLNIETHIKDILSANLIDVKKARDSSLSEALIDRLTITEAGCRSLSESLIKVASLPDPLGAIEDMKLLPNGLYVGRMRIPLGLIAFICEARPGAVVEAAAMALKSGNGILVKPGKEAQESARVLGNLMREALESSGLPPGVLYVLADMEREGVKELVQMEDLVDVVIPRGGEGLIRFVTENSKVPVLKHYKGVCHLYVDSEADLIMAASIAINAKAQRPGTCNAMECLLVNNEIAEEFLQRLGPELKMKGIQVRSCPKALSILKPLGVDVSLAEDSDYYKEYLDLILNLKVVDSMDEALRHIRTYGSRHTESIVTKDIGRATRFIRAADASCVMANASTRLNDGGVLGLGAEIGISTSKLHAYGPMGLIELTSRKFVVLGEGNLRN